MKQPILKSNDLVKYGFNRLTPPGISVKDSCSFEFGGIEYIICTNITDGGLVVFKKENGSYVVLQKLFSGWSMMWGPCVVEENGQLIVFCNDTGGATPWWQTQDIKCFDWTPGGSPANFRNVAFEQDKGRIDPEVIKIGATYYLFYVIMDWNNGEWWDVYYSTSDTLAGPYSGEHNISQMIETGIEEAPHVIENNLYWSVGDSSYDSHIRRGDLVSSNGLLDVIEDTEFRLGAVGSDVATHPDSYNGKLRFTVKQGSSFFIAELII